MNHGRWESEAATAGNAFIAATRERVHTLIERAGPHRCEVVALSRAR